ncbi:hypothetical protein CTI12_AA247060 [Artemisia annua]|uniref:Uncharacterized protein n=1 Tax=Artemisia annua TaxID=35608 RepID=A0A2U1NNC8_ARTAN|nr:hypothetical protein CTI12_AA247060 [Artemisia annua]
METTQPSYPGGGAGGKFRKPPRRRPSTPYARPSQTVSNTNTNPEEPHDGGWLSKLVVNPARRLIVGGAARIIPSFFSKSDEYDDDDDEDEEEDSDGDLDTDNQDIDATVNAYSEAKHTFELGSSGHAGPSNEMDKLKGISERNNVQQDKSKSPIADLGLDTIENMLKGKQFSRDESNRLMEILNSRLVDVSNTEEKKTPNVIPQWQAKVDVLDCENPSTLAIGKQYDTAVLETPNPRLHSNMQDEVAASPVDIARAYMGSRTSELGFNTYNITSTDNKEQHNDLYPSKPHFLTPSSKSSTCWPGAMVQDQQGYMTPQSQRGRYGLHNFPRTPYSRTVYSRTKPKLSQLQPDSRPNNSSHTLFQQSRTPNPWQTQTKTSSDVMDGGYGSLGPIRRVRNKFVSEPQSEGPRRLSSAQIASSSSASRSSVPVFQKNSVTAWTSGTSNLYTADKHEEPSKGELNPAGPSNETVRKILEQLDRHKPTPKEKAEELKIATGWKRLPSQDTTLMPRTSTTIATLRGPDSQRSGVLNDKSSSVKETDVGVRFQDPVTIDAASRRSSSVDDADAGPSFGFSNAGAADEVSLLSLYLHCLMK